MNRHLLILVAGLASFAVSAAGSVEQRIDRLERQMSRLTVLTMEMRDLRKDLQENYGAVEEMVHQMELLKRQQSNSYIDLDQRIKKIEDGKSRVVEANPSITGSSDSKEIDAYNSAFALVRSIQYQKALSAFNRLIKKFPKGEYTGDSWYWIGRLHTINGNKSEASKAYAQAKSILQSIVKKSPGSAQAKRAADKLKKINR
ncbi:MAG: tetratricopeptide repeat protein [Gammaproteobacteria bacterium]|uniref:Tetratricopeptide repeat protein n=1 Tax=Candidatus Thiopontia autotrophica TaxID=2841688 RepID=A0A8J6TNA4_9GAMM|nr:tetratricopeptide repeat protein [Candidatus Thiopontia autotrophica]MBL6969682.1 tetratricopeptide repeat protein [Gammaproteobacteria bacterium]